MAQMSGVNHLHELWHVDPRCQRSYKEMRTKSAAPLEIRCTAFHLAYNTSWVNLADCQMTIDIGVEKLKVFRDRKLFATLHLLES